MPIVSWKKKEVRVDEIDVDPRLQVRAVEPPIEEYEEILRKNRRVWPFPFLRCVLLPPDLDNESERLVLVEGFTRLGAAVAAGVLTFLSSGRRERTRRRWRSRAAPTRPTGIAGPTRTSVTRSSGLWNCRRVRPRLLRFA
jgi:hypothetical protein